MKPLFRVSVAGALLGMAVPLLALPPHSVPPPLPAQRPAEIVFSTNLSNDRLLRLDFRNGTAAVVNTPFDALVRKQLEGIAVRNDPPGVSVIACDSWGNRVMFYPNAQGPAQVTGQTIAPVKAPDGVSLDGGNNLFLVSSPFEWWLPRQVWTIPVGGGGPGGYAGKQLIDGVVPANILEDTKVAGFESGKIKAGDLLVLAQSPAKVFLYRFGPDPDGAAPVWTSLGSGWNRRLFTDQFPFGARPTGIAFAPNLDLLVSSWSGTIYRFNTNGVRNATNFVSSWSWGAGRLKIAVGMQGGDSYAFVGNRSGGGKVLRFLIKDNGTGQLAGTVDEKVYKPNGVGIASVTPTPLGAANVQLSPEVSLLFDNVVKAGFTNNGLLEFVDNRSCEDDGDEFTHPCDQKLRDFFPGAANAALRASLPDVWIPSYIQGFRKRLPSDCSECDPSGPSSFLLAIIDTTAKFKLTSLFHAEEEIRGLGQPPLYGCEDGVYLSAFQSRTFYVPETDAPKSEPDIVERLGEGQRVFTDISDGCGSNKGSGWNFSLYLTGRDTREPIDIVEDKLQNLRSAFDSLETFIDGDLFGTLDSSLEDAESAFADLLGDTTQANRDAVQAALEAFRNAAGAPANDGSFNNTLAGRNVNGELTARAKSALFILPKIPVTTEEAECPCSGAFAYVQGIASGNGWDQLCYLAADHIEWQDGEVFKANIVASGTFCYASIPSYDGYYSDSGEVLLTPAQASACEAILTTACDVGEEIL